MPCDFRIFRRPSLSPSLSRALSKQPNYFPHFGCHHLSRSPSLSPHRWPRHYEDVRLSTNILLQVAQGSCSAVRCSCLRFFSYLVYSVFQFQLSAFSCSFLVQTSIDCILKLQVRRSSWNVFITSKK